PTAALQRTGDDTRDWTVLGCRGVRDVTPRGNEDRATRSYGVLVRRCRTSVRLGGESFARPIRFARPVRPWGRGTDRRQGASAVGRTARGHPLGGTAGDEAHRLGRPLKQLRGTERCHEESA